MSELKQEQLTFRKTYLNMMLVMWFDGDEGHWFGSVGDLATGKILLRTSGAFLKMSTLEVALQAWCREYFHKHQPVGPPNKRDLTDGEFKALVSDLKALREFLQDVPTSMVVTDTLVDDRVGMKGTYLYSKKDKKSLTLTLTRGDESMDINLARLIALARLASF